MESASKILKILDDSAADFVFPMLDNGYIYPADVRMTVFHGDEQWALIIEVLGVFNKFIDPAEAINTEICGFGNCLKKRDESGFVSRDAYENWVQAHPFDNNETIYPIAAGPSGPLLANEDDWYLSPAATDIRIRDQVVELPGAANYELAGVTPEHPLKIQSHELLRTLVPKYRDSLLATEMELRRLLLADVPQLMQLAAWRHPDLAGGEMPSETTTFAMISEVLASGDRSRYRPSEAANTSWQNWPEGGVL